MVMRIPLTKYGWPQVVVFPAISALILIVWPMVSFGRIQNWIVLLVELIVAVDLIWSLSFFRNPYRQVPSDTNLLLSPADGKITDIETVEENGFIGGQAVRIGIFLSIFNVHINRMPCNAKVETITYKKGKYKNAMNPRSGRVNESNDIELLRSDNPQDKLLVRQISGAIARRIVCGATEGQKLVGGEQFGMIKFGSRTELYVPVRENVKFLVRIGDKVKAGVTVLAKYEK